MQPRPLPSVIEPSESMQNWPWGVSPPMRFCPSPSWPTWPEVSPDAEMWKQQLVSRGTSAWAPAAKAATVAKFLMLTIGMSTAEASVEGSVRFDFRPLLLEGSRIYNFGWALQVSYNMVCNHQLSPSCEPWKDGSRLAQR